MLELLSDCNHWLFSQSDHISRHRKQAPSAQWYAVIIVYCPSLTNTRAHARNFFVFPLICVNIRRQMSPGQLKSLQRQKSALNVSGISIITLHRVCSETTLGFSGAHDRLKRGSDTYHLLLEVTVAFTSTGFHTLRVNNNSTCRWLHPLGSQQ